MNPSPTIALQSLRFEFEVFTSPNETSPIEIEPGLELDILQVLEEELKQIDPHGHVLQMDFLEIYTEDLNLETFQSEFSAALRRALRLKLSGLRPARQMETQGSARLRAWLYFLQHGHFPWWFQATSHGSAALVFEKIWEEDRFLLNAWISNAVPNRQVSKRLFHNGGHVILRDLVRHFLEKGKWPGWGKSIFNAFFPLSRPGSQQNRDHQRLFLLLCHLQQDSKQPLGKLLRHLWTNSAVRRRITAEFPTYLLRFVVDLVFAPAIPGVSQQLDQIILALSPPLAPGAYSVKYWHPMLKAMAEENLEPDGNQPHQILTFWLKMFSQWTSKTAEALQLKLSRHPGPVGNLVHQMETRGKLMSPSNLPEDNRPSLQSDQQCIGSMDVLRFLQKFHPGQLPQPLWQQVGILIRGVVPINPLQAIPQIFGYLLFYHELLGSSQREQLLEAWRKHPNAALNQREGQTLALIRQQTQRPIPQINHPSQLPSQPVSSQAVVVAEIIFLAEQILPMHARHAWNQYLKHISLSEIMKGRGSDEMLETLLMYAFPQKESTHQAAEEVMARLQVPALKKFHHVPQALAQKVQQQKESVLLASQKSQPSSADELPEFKAPSAELEEVQMQKAMWEVGTEDKIYIQNAGLILVWPFLTRFLRNLDLLSEDRFNDGAAAQRAVYLLQYLVDSTWMEQEPFSEPPEFLLVFNKLLCGIDPQSYVELGQGLTEEEQNHARMVLNAVLEGWPAMKSSTISGLQQTFFQREGLLSRNLDHWTLTVEQKGYDAVLPQLNWGLSLVNLPFNDLVFHVEWR